jgi:calcineurin-like phosphoesterase family protein
VLRYCSRPFQTIEEHDRVLIENWNNKVGKNDLIYILGDFTLSTNNEVIKAYADQLNGRKILIKGNHDKNKMPEGVFDEITLYKEIRDGDYKVILFHYAIESWLHRFSKDNRGENPKIKTIHLHGHSHSLTPIIPDRYDVGVDSQGYMPCTLKEILNRERDKLIGH